MNAKPLVMIISMNKPIQIILIFLVTFFSWDANGQIPTPGDSTAKKYLILGGVAHVGNGEVIQNSAIAVENGILRFVKNQLIYRIDQSEYDTVIHLNGHHVYPGFIACNTTLGLNEIEAVRATRDFDDVGDYNPNVRSIVAYNTDSRIIPTVRSNGVLLGQITPRGGIISGSSSIMQFDAWNWEDATVREDDGIHLNWPPRFVKTGWWANPGETKENKKADEKVQEIYRFFEAAKAYASTPKPSNINLRFEAMKGLFEGTKTLYVHCNYAREIIKAIDLKRAFDIDNVVIVGGYDAYLVPEVLKDNNVAVILHNLHALPLRADDPIDLPYQMAGKLKALGIEVTVSMTGDMEAMNTRNLPFTAGTAVTYGMEYEEAVKLISLDAAKIIGIDETYGSLEAGKSATFFISKGDALDMKTNEIYFAMIDGRVIKLTNPQKELYKKYQRKYGVVKAENAPK